MLNRIVVASVSQRCRSLNMVKGYCNGAQAFRAYFPEFIGNVQSTLSTNYPDIPNGNRLGFRTIASTKL